jgi:hypothetical protein
MKPKVIRHVEDETEFYTHVFTGESGMSVSGLARLCDTPQSTVDDLLRDLVTGKFRSDCLKPFASKDLWLPERGVNNAKIVRDEVCAAVVEHYGYEAIKQTEKARFAFRKFGAIGVRTWIQSLTGWKQHCKQRLIDGFVDQQSHRIKGTRFRDDFYALLYRKRGNGWEDRDPKKRPGCVGTWTNRVVYERFPDGVHDRLNEVNPRVNGYRKDKHHEHLKQFGSDHLDAHLYALKAIANFSGDGDWDAFIRHVERAFPTGEPLQLSLIDMLEFYESTDVAS